MVANKASKVSSNGKSTHSAESLVSSPGRDLVPFLVQNLIMTRAELMRTKLKFDNKDIDKECGYPASLGFNDYLDMYKRYGIAARLVRIYPEECWTQDPEIYDSEDDSVVTPFEKAWRELCDRLNVYHYMQRVDEVSGIGRYGILMLGFNGRSSLDSPAPGYSDKNDKARGRPAKVRLEYLRVLDEGSAEIASLEDKGNSPRLNLPRFYNIMLGSLAQDTNKDIAPPGSSAPGKTTKLHWTRAVHVADNLLCSEHLGTPRQEDIFNWLLDIRKVMGSSGEMHYKGAWPGLSFELDPAVAMSDADFDEEETREEIEKYMAGLQRYIAVLGLKANTLTPNVQSPKEVINALLMLICISKSIPSRILMGSEEGRLASVQDKETWNQRVMTRRNKYLTPRLIRPFVDILIKVGVLPKPKNGVYNVFWPDANALSDADTAKVAKDLTEALMNFVNGGCGVMVDPVDWFVRAWKLPAREAKALVDRAKKNKIAVQPVGSTTGSVEKTSAGQKTKLKGAAPKKAKKVA